jgi:hypothetical protein
MQQVTVTARGLFLGQNDLGAVPDGALGQADNCVISKDGIVETRRGLANIATKVLTRLLAFKTYLIGWAADPINILSRSSDKGQTWIDYAGTYPASGSKDGPIHSAEMNGNLYFTSSTGIQRLDSFTGTPEPAGIPGGLDIQADLGAAGTAVPPGNQVAYRVVWGKRDANGNLLLGAPSGRGIVTHPAPYVITIGNLVRAAGVVTATLSAGVLNVLRISESVTLSPGEANFAGGPKTVTGVTPTTFTYTEAGTATSNTAAQTFTGPARDITVTTTIPRGLPSGAFFQVSRSPNSGLETQVPDDNLGLVYEGTPPSTSTLSQLSRASGTTVTATTTANHGYAAGMIVQVPGSAGSGTFAVAGQNVAATSPDATTWTGRTIPAGTYYTGCVWNGTVFAAAGNSVAASSPDGITWTSRTIGAGFYYAAAWNGTVFVAIGTVGATSPDGITWTTRTIPAATYQGVAWNGTSFAAVGNAVVATSPDGITWTAGTMAAGNYYAVRWNGTVFAAVGVNVAATSPDGITWTARTIPAGTYYGVDWNGSLFSAVGLNVAATSPDGITWTVQTIPAGQYNGVAWSGNVFVATGASVAATSTNGGSWTAKTIPAGNYYRPAISGAFFADGQKTIVGTPTGATFTYTEWGNNGTVASTQTITPLSAAFSDSIPSGFIGAALYTNPNQGTIQAAASRVALCQDIATFRGFMFSGNVTYPSRASIYLLAVGGTGGIVAGDTITVDGIPYTAHASLENISSRTFIAYTAGTPAQNIANTVASLLRIINRTLSNTITALYLSGPNDVPGLFYLEENGTAVTMRVTFSKPTAWSIQSLKAPENRKSELRWSSANQPDAWPLLNTQQLGSVDKTLKRIVATRDMLVVVKDDGLWRVTGFDGVWDMQPLDPTQGCPAPESMVAFENAVFGVLDSGVVRITEGGVESITTPIYPALETLLATAALATTAAETFGIAYHSAHKYILWLPSAITDTEAKQAYVYDSWTQAWTRWLPPTGVTGWNHGIVDASGDRMLLVDGTSVYREKKAMDDTDLQDATNTAIPVTVKYLPKFGGDPGRLWHFQDVALIFKRVKFGTGTASLAISTNIAPVEDTIPLTGTDYGVDSTAGTQTTIRALVPLEKARASQLNVKVSHAEAGSAFQLQGLSVVFRPGSTRVGR